jgi:transcriptional regulator with XRE-family HTH domain
MSIFGDRLKQLRINKNIMQKDMAQYLEIETISYQRYEYGDREPKFDKLIKLCDYFNVSADYLLGRTDNPEINK